VGVIAVIDLGEVPAGRVFDDDPPAAPRRRWPAAALVLAAALSTVVAADPVPRPLPAAVVDVPGDVRVLVDGDRLFVVQPFALSQGRGDGRYVAAVHLMDLEELWRVDLPLGGDLYGITTVDNALALTGEPPLTTPDGQVADNVLETVGLDMTTGALLWRHKGFVEGETVSGRLILSTQFGRPGAVPAGSGPGGVGKPVRAVSGSGEVVWSYAPPSGALRSYHTAGDAVRRLVVLTDGRVELRDTETGQLVTSRLVGPLPRDEGAGRYVEVVGDLLLVRVGSEVLAYGLDSLDLRWRRPYQIGRDGWFTPCGDAICVVYEEGGLKVLDPSTGRVRWSDPRWTRGFAAGKWLMVTDGDPLHALRTVAVVDPYSGQVKRDLGRWHALDVVGGSIVALRFDGGRALVARLDPERGALVLRVLSDVVPASCRVRLPAVWCRRTDNTLGVWRVPG
jgi:outer membrane protein assembly factor BamB